MTKLLPAWGDVMMRPFGAQSESILSRRVIFARIPMTTHRIFSGIQPTGELHLGNYLGALRNWVDLQQKPEFDEVIYCIVDYHALTVEGGASLAENSMNVLASVVACGIDPERAVLFRQSDVPEHTELAWVFATCAALGDLNRMTQFKDKAAQNPDNVNVGLFTYPVLQAADILLYRADRVPVGEDQVQHLEFSREIVRRFNRRFGELFPEPKPLLSAVPRLKGLDGTAKMSKSKGNTVALGESPDDIRQKLRGAVTDPQRKRRSDPGDPDVCNVFTLHKSFSVTERCQEIDRDCRTAAIGCVDCKKELGDRIIEDLTPIRERQNELRSNPGELRDLAEHGRERAQAIAQPILAEVREQIGVGGAHPASSRPAS
jgi:tryptophanyl-tRNA synthetase